eukprot:c4672_g1_i1.p1 GENE.c4672_g1_i1~~c4672_g1_i1.p1  ORF type:complete len:240 (+),score=23.16 c4672_g1_i1:44-763(+)
MLVEDVGRVLAFAAFFSAIHWTVRLFCPENIISAFKPFNSKGPKRAVLAGYVTSLCHGTIEVSVGLWIHLPRILNEPFLQDKSLGPMSDPVALQCAILLGYMIADSTWTFDITPLYYFHHFATVVIWGYCLYYRIDMNFMGLGILIGEAPNPAINLRWLFRSFQLSKPAEICEVIFVLIWLPVRQGLELMCCYHYVWTSDAMPMFWRLILISGNLMTAFWTAEIFGLLRRRLFGKSKQK